MHKHTYMHIHTSIHTYTYRYAHRYICNTHIHIYTPVNICNTNNSKVSNNFNNDQVKQAFQDICHKDHI